MKASRMGVQAIVAIAFMVFAFGVWASGDSLELRWLRFYSIAVGVVLAALAAWEHLIWRHRVAQQFTRAPADISGTWKGTLETFWKNPDGSSVPSKTVYLVVRQTASSVSAALLSDESRSVSSLASVRSDGVTRVLAFLYLNRPKSRHASTSPMHHGSALLEIAGRPAKRLHGSYWTDRDTRGELDFVRRSTDLADDFEEAERVFARQGTDGEPTAAP